MRYFNAMMSELVNSPVALDGKQAFMSDWLTVEVLGVPGMRMAPTPAAPSLPPEPQLMT
jgi:hypothetical protein